MPRIMLEVRASNDRVRRLFDEPEFCAFLAYEIDSRTTNFDSDARFQERLDAWRNRSWASMQLSVTVRPVPFVEE